MTHDKPQFLVAAEELARTRGVRPEEILEEDRTRALDPEYPGPDCLEPVEVELFLMGDPDEIPERLEEHASSCVFCLTLLCSASGSQDELDRVLALTRSAQAGEPTQPERTRVTSKDYALEPA